jgi:hypothetical protein
MTDIDQETAQRVLALPVKREGGQTIRDYLFDLLAAFWAGEADPKYGMTGESDWQYELYEPLRDAGLIPEWADGYGIGYRTTPTTVEVVSGAARYDEDQKLADDLIAAAIKELRAS